MYISESTETTPTDIIENLQTELATQSHNTVNHLQSLWQIRPAQWPLWEVEPTPAARCNVDTKRGAAGLKNKIGIPFDIGPAAILEHNEISICKGSAGL